MSLRPRALLRPLSRLSWCPSSLFPPTLFFVLTASKQKKEEDHDSPNPPNLHRPIRDQHGPPLLTPPPETPLARHLAFIPLPFSDHPSSLIPCDQTQRIRGRERDKQTHQRTIIPHVISFSFRPIPSINTKHPSHLEGEEER